MENLEKLKFQDSIIRFIAENPSVTQARFTSKFGLHTNGRKQVTQTLDYLIQKGYVQKTRGATRFEHKYSLTAEGQDKAFNTFAQEYLEKTDTKERQNKHLEVSTLLAIDQRKYLLFTRRLSWASFILSVIALGVTIFLNYRNGSSYKKDQRYQVPKDKITKEFPHKNQNALD